MPSFPRRSNTGMRGLVQKHLPQAQRFMTGGGSTVSVISDSFHQATKEMVIGTLSLELVDHPERVHQVRKCHRLDRRKTRRLAETGMPVRVEL